MIIYLKFFGALAIIYFLWVAWLKKAGFYNLPKFNKNIPDAILYTVYRLYYSACFLIRKENGTR